MCKVGRERGLIEHEDSAMSHSTNWLFGVVALVACAGASFWWLNRTSTYLDPNDPPKFAEDTVTAAPIKFDGERAMKYLKQICDIGPRISNTEGMRKQQAII